MVQVLLTLNKRVPSLSDGLPAARSWLKVKKGKMFSKLNRNNGRKSLKNSHLRQYGLHLSRLSSSHKKALVISVIPMKITNSFADEVNA